MTRVFAPFIGAALSIALTACGADENGPVIEGSGDLETLAIEVHEGDFATIQQFVTPGGVSVWLVEEPSIPILSLRMAWQAGRSNDPDGLEGLTNAMVYHMNEGAGGLDTQAFFKRMEEVNMSFGCSAANETTSCSASMLTDNAAGSFELIALALSEPRFDDGPFERFLREQEVSLNTRETNARYLAGRARRAALYPDHPFAREVDADSLAAITQDAMRAQKDLIMVQDGLLVTAVGAIAPEALAPLIDQVVAGLPQSSEPVETEDVVLADAVSAPIIIDLPQPQSLVSFAAPGIKREDPDFYPAFIANYILGGGGFGSRLMDDLRVDRGLTYGISTRLSSGDKLQIWSGGGQTNNESVGEFVTGIKDNLAAIASDGVTEEELTAAKAYLMGSYPLGFDSNAAIAQRMMGVRLEDLPVDFFDNRNALIESVTLDDVNRIAAAYLSPENFTFVIVGQPQGLDG
ncbi:MAG: pitrilysin family protein [Pseudomonadota bacterium]